MKKVKEAAQDPASAKRKRADDASDLEKDENELMDLLKKAEELAHKIRTKKQRREETAWSCPRWSKQHKSFLVVNVIIAHSVYLLFMNKLIGAFEQYLETFLTWIR